MRVEIYGNDGENIATCSMDKTGNVSVETDVARLKYRLYAGIIATVGIERRVFRPEDGEKFMHAVIARFNRPPGTTTSGIIK